MEWILLLLGILLVVLAFTDLLQTTIEHNGAGFLMQRIGAVLWKFFLFLAGKDGKKKVLGLAGLFIVFSVVLSWIFSIWLGFTLIFNFQPDSVVLTSSRLTTDFLDKIYYIGYTLSTLGNGDLQASNNFWRILTVLVSISGLLIITLSITYLLPLLSAVSNKRKLCAYINFLGSSPEDFIMNGWNGKDLSNLNQHIFELGTKVLDHKEKHLLYPVLHYFHSTEKKFAAPVALTNLDETVSVIMASPYLRQRVDLVSLKVLRSSLDDYLDILQDTNIHQEDPEPHLPKLDRLYSSMDIDRNKIEEYFGTLTNRRKLLNGMVQTDGWQWPIDGEEK